MVRTSLPPTLAAATTTSWNNNSSMSEEMKALITNAKEIYNTSLKECESEQTASKIAWIVSAPGRVNLIGDHTDYTGGGYMIPFAIQYNTICYGTGHYHTSTSTAATQISIRVVFSSLQTHLSQADTGTSGVVVKPKSTKTQVYERHISCSPTSGDLEPPSPPLKDEYVQNGNAVPDSTLNSDCNKNNAMDTWINLVVGTVIQFVPDLPHEGCKLDLVLSFSTNIPFQDHDDAGLFSTFSSIEIATALFLECILQEMAYSSSTNSLIPATNSGSPHSMDRALRSHRAETEWALNPCGVIDQIASSCSIDNHFMLFDSKNMSLTHIPFQVDTSKSMSSNSDNDDDHPVFVICNSGINSSTTTTDIEFGKRRRECHDAVDAIQSVPLYHVESLRDATVADIEEAYKKNKLDETLCKRSLHVVTENRRVMECKTALKLCLWDKVGALMNQSHDSLRDNFHVSCKEIDFLVQVARDFTVQEEQATSTSLDEADTQSKASIIDKKVVYGSRLTGNGFGGCTITFVKNIKYAKALVHELQTKYAATSFGYKKACDCFITLPSSGAQIVAVDTI
jgi:galactokinase